MPPQLFVPASVMPMPPQIGRMIWDHDEMERPRGDGVVAARADVGLSGSVWLDGSDGDVVVGSHPAKIAQATTANVSAIAPTTIAMSKAVRV